jgi:glycolate oxidase iron-sulfur subunit
VPYGELLEAARASSPPGMSLRARLVRFVLQHVLAHPHRLRWTFRLLRTAELLGLRRLLPRTARQLLPAIPKAAARAPIPPGTYRPRGTERGRVALFTGCVMEQLFGDVNRKTLELLLQNGFAVDVPAAQRCCGALLVHNGQAEPAESLARANVAAFRDTETVIVNSAGCGATLQHYGHLLGGSDGAAFGHKVRDVCQFLDQQGLVAVPAANASKVAYDDPCHLCHGQGVRDEPRRLLARVPGLQLCAHDRPEDCCGSAGIYNLLQPDLAGRIGARKIESLAASGAEVVATGNPGCMLQIRALAQQRNLPLRVVHPVELLLPEATT